MKKCSKCGEEKELAKFEFRKDTQKYRGQCIKCRVDYNKNKDIIKKRIQEWRKNNPEKLKAYREKNKEKLKAYREKNKEKLKAYDKIYNKINREKRLKLRKKWQQNNKEKINKKELNKRKNNPIYKLKLTLSQRILIALKRQYSEKAFKTIKLLSCTIPFLKQHLESQFTPEMDWGNHGTYWHIDHIIPCSLYDLSKEHEQLKAFNYRNLRPLEKTENIIKRNKLNMELIKVYNLEDLLPSI